MMDLLNYSEQDMPLFNELVRYSDDRLSTYCFESFSDILLIRKIIGLENQIAEDLSQRKLELFYALKSYEMISRVGPILNSGIDYYRAEKGLLEIWQKGGFVEARKQLLRERRGGKLMKFVSVLRTLLPKAGLFSIIVGWDFFEIIKSISSWVEILLTLLFNVV